MNCVICLCGQILFSNYTFVIILNHTQQQGCGVNIETFLFFSHGKLIDMI